MYRRNWLDELWDNFFHWIFWLIGIFLGLLILFFPYIFQIAFLGFVVPLKGLNRTVYDLTNSLERRAEMSGKYRPRSHHETIASLMIGTSIVVDAAIVFMGLLACIIGVALIFGT